MGMTITKKILRTRDKWPIEMSNYVERARSLISRILILVSHTRTRSSPSHAHGIILDIYWSVNSWAGLIEKTSLSFKISVGFSYLIFISNHLAFYDPVGKSFASLWHLTVIKAILSLLFVLTCELYGAL